MNKSTRTVMSKRNFTVSVVGRIVGMLASFVSRTVFVKTIGAEYLGLGGFFGNVFSLLSLCELGFGAAITQTLYRPIAVGDEQAVSGIISYYSKINRIVACVCFCLSIAGVPVLPLLVKSAIETHEIVAAYLLFCLHSFVSLVLVPKKMLVICDQRLYVVTLVKSVFSLVALVCECLVLICLKSYLGYLCVRIAFIAIEDLLVNWYADRKYPFLAIKRKIIKHYKEQIHEKVKALMFHKTGAVLSRSTDSILVSIFAGLYGMGKFSNYSLIIGTVGAFFDVAINALSASIGNLGAVNRGEKSEKVMRRLYFINFCLLTVSCSVIVSTINQIIALWLGEDMLFTNAEMLIIVASFYFSCIRDPVQVFVHSFGLFKESRFIPIIRAALNLAFSVFFIRKIGIAGVFLGTALSTFACPLVGEVYVLYRYGFRKKCSAFLKEMFGYIGFSFMSCAVCFCITNKLPQDLCGLAVRGIISFFVSCLIICLFYFGNQFFAYFLQILLRFFSKQKKHNQIVKMNGNFKEIPKKIINN